MGYRAQVRRRSIQTKTDIKYQVISEHLKVMALKFLLLFLDCNNDGLQQENKISSHITASIFFTEHKIKCKTFRWLVFTHRQGQKKKKNHPQQMFHKNGSTGTHFHIRCTLSDRIGSINYIVAIPIIKTSTMSVHKISLPIFHACHVVCTPDSSINPVLITDCYLCPETNGSCIR